MPIIQPSSHDYLPVVYDVVVYDEHVADVGDESKEVKGVSAISVIGGARDSGASESGDGSEVREKPREVRDVSREEAKMKAIEEIVALHHERGLYFEEELEGCPRERYRVERERTGAIDINGTCTVRSLKREVSSRLSPRESKALQINKQLIAQHSYHRWERW